MAMLSTKQLMDEFFEDLNKDEEYTRRVRIQVDRPELYEYEKEIGKQLIDMNVDELFELVRRFRRKSGFSISYASYSQTAVWFRKMFDYYSDHYELIRNPWNDKRMKGASACDRFIQSNSQLTMEIVEEAIGKLYEKNEQGRALYIESIIRLYLCGFATPEEIVSLKESMIDFRAHTAMIGGKVVRMDDHCFELLCAVHNMDALPGRRADFKLLSWHGSYFKFPTRYGEIEEFEKRTPVQVGQSLGRIIAERMRGELGYDMNYRKLHLLGFYNYMVETYGQEETNQMLLSRRDSNAQNDIVNAARNYGIYKNDGTEIKFLLRPYIKD